MKNTKIAYTHHTVNLWWGCEKVSEACKNCYAEAIAKRFKKDCFGHGAQRWDRTRKVLDELCALQKSASCRGVKEVVFINSMSDFFEPDILLQLPRERFLANAAWMENLVFLLLTKRPEAIETCIQFARAIPANCHIGITAENQKRLDERMYALKDFKGKVFLSCEPMLERISIEKHKDKIDWVICGGESGHGARNFKIEEAFLLKNQCENVGIPFFFKQLGAKPVLCAANASERHDVSELLINTRQFPAWHPMQKGEK